VPVPVYADFTLALSVVMALRNSQELKNHQSFTVTVFLFGSLTVDNNYENQKLVTNLPVLQCTC